MTAFGSRLARLIGALYRLAFLAIALCFVAAAASTYIAATGQGFTGLRWAIAGLGRLIDGQHIDRIAIRAELLPAQSRLQAEATLTLKAVNAPRGRFFFLLNPALTITSVHATNASGIDQHARLFRLWTIAAIELEQELAGNETLQVAISYEGRPKLGLLGSDGDAIASDEVRLGPDSFWYPHDAHGFFEADVRVVAPANLVIVNGGSTSHQIARGGLRQTSWTYERPIAAMSLIAGRYRDNEREIDGVHYRIALAEDVDLDVDRIANDLAKANRSLSQVFGDSGFHHQTIFVSRTLRRAFNDGGGLIGTSLRYFRRYGDHAFGLLAHELAHNWWGATVSEQWLAPRTGGEWIVEGFATFSSWIAVENEYGRAGLARTITDDLFDPDRQGVIADMSVLDNLLDEKHARDTIYRKGGYAALMLRSVIGKEAYYTALHDFLDQHRYRQVSEHDLQQSLEQSTGKDLANYFEDWIRTRRLADLAFEKTPEGNVRLTNHGEARIDSDVEIALIHGNDAPPKFGSGKIGDSIESVAAGDELVIDPFLSWADPWRSNNRYPTHDDPVYVAASAQHSILIAEGEHFPWARTTLALLDDHRQKQHTWELPRGLTGAPVWSPDGKHAAFAHADDQELVPVLVRLDSEGARHNLGRGVAPQFGPDGSLYAARDDRIVAYAADASERTIVHLPDWSLDVPVPSPNGQRLAYVAAQRNQLEIHVLDLSSSRDRRLTVLDRDRVMLAWSPDAAILYACYGANWDWQIVAIPLGDESPRVLAGGIAMINDLSLSPDGTRLAFTAAPEPTYPQLHSVLYVLNVENRKIDTIDVANADLEDIDWEDEHHLLAIAAETRPDLAGALPVTRRIKRIDLRDHSQSDF